MKGGKCDNSVVSNLQQLPKIEKRIQTIRKEKITMKKLLLSLFLFLIIGKVQALTYTPYSDYGPYIEEKIESSDLIDVKTERRYKYYKFIKNKGSYDKQTNEEYQYLDKEDFIYTTFSDWTENIIKGKEDRIIEEKTFYQYSKVGPIDEVIFKATNDSNIKELKLYENGNLLDYNIVSGNFGVLKENDEIIIKLSKEIELDNLKFSITSDGDAQIYYTYELAFKGKGITYQNIEGGMLAKRTHTLYNKQLGYMNYYQYYSEQQLETGQGLKFVKQITKYRYKDKLYRLYNLEKEYYKDYLTHTYQEYIYKDQDLYKDYYSKRERQIIKDKLITQLVDVPNTDSPKQLSSSYQDNKTKEEKHEFIASFPLFIISVILILVLSKRFKIKKRCAKV